MRYSNELRDRIYVKGYGFLSLSKNMAKNLSNKYNQKRSDSAKKSTTDVTKTASEKAIQKTAEATGDLIGNKIADKTTSFSKKSTSDKVEVDVGRASPKDVPKKRYISPEERQQIIDELGWYKNIIMKHQKIANLLDNEASNRPSKFRTRNCVEINDESKDSYKLGSDIKFTTTIQRSNLCDYADAYILVKGTRTITGAGDDERNSKTIRSKK